MGIIGTIVIGFVAGVIAKFLMPGKNEPAGFILTTILGIVAIVATLGQARGWYGPNEGAGFIGAIVGAVIVLAICGFISRPPYYSLTERAPGRRARANGSRGPNGSTDQCCVTRPSSRQLNWAIFCCRGAATSSRGSRSTSRMSARSSSLGSAHQSSSVCASIRTSIRSVIVPPMPLQDNAGPA